MRNLLALLDEGTHGTLAEPPRSASRRLQDSSSDQRLARVGTGGTRGTPQIEHVRTHNLIAQHVTDLADAYAERIAIVLEAGDIGEAEARRMAEAEIGRLFVGTFIPGKVAP